MDRKERLATGLGVSDAEAERLATLWDRVLNFNQTTNLTAVTDEDGVYQKHFLDSVAAVKLLKQGANVADLGSGGGFPALVLAILRPDVNFTLVEATGKKARFLADTATEMNLSNVTVVSVRIEDLGRGAGRSQFDAVTARALAQLNTLMEYAAPLLKVGGMLIAYKGKGADEERAQAEHARKVLHLTEEEPVRYNAGGERALLLFRKQSETPETYPRSYKKMKEKPL